MWIHIYTILYLLVVVGFNLSNKCSVALLLMLLSEILIFYLINIQHEQAIFSLTYSVVLLLHPPDSSRV